MSFRVSAFSAIIAVLALSSFAPTFAQPQAPTRPGGTFGSAFRTGGGSLLNPQQGFYGQNQQGSVNPSGPQVFNGGYQGQLMYPQAFGTGVGNPQLPPSGVVGSFGNLGHWYGGSSGYYGHWYPNGIANGRGVLGGSVGGGMGGGIGGGMIGGNNMMGGGMMRQGGGLNSTLGTAATLGATMNMFRR